MMLACMPNPAFRCGFVFKVLFWSPSKQQLDIYTIQLSSSEGTVWTYCVDDIPTSRKDLIIQLIAHLYSYPTPCDTQAHAIIEDIALGRVNLTTSDGTAISQGICSAAVVVYFTPLFVPSGGGGFGGSGGFKVSSRCKRSVCR